MNVLFLALGKIESLKHHGIYTDLLREFVKHGHTVYAVTSTERRNHEDTFLNEEDSNKILVVKTLNIQKTNIVEKGIATILVSGQFKKAIKHYFKNISFDLVLYPTPPITLLNVVKYIKHRDGAKTYLMLKDIFPQNAVDLGMLSTTGIKGIIYGYFRRKEKKLYAISDKIGCMSPANVEYVLKHNPEIPKEKVELCPNCIEVQDVSVTPEERKQIREKYGLPQNKKIFVYGGNLGKPQGVPFIIECLKTQLTNNEAFFFIVGNGTEYPKLEAFFNEYKPTNMKLMPSIPKDDYDHMLAACDVGMIFLDHRFTIPNFPSRLLSYMQAGLPVLACTDPNTDIGKVIVEGGFGWWCESDDAESFENLDNTIASFDSSVINQKTRKYLNEEYSVKKGYSIIQEKETVK